MGAAPKARSDGVVCEPVDDELLVYDLERHVAHSLWTVAARVKGHARVPVSHDPIYRLNSSVTVVGCSASVPC
jgi:hypothetical protein